MIFVPFSDGRQTTPQANRNGRAFNRKEHAASRIGKRYKGEAVEKKTLCNGTVSADDDDGSI